MKYKESRITKIDKDAMAMTFLMNISDLLEDIQKKQKSVK